MIPARLQAALKLAAMRVALAGHVPVPFPSQAKQLHIDTVNAPVVPTSNSVHGDYQWNFALRMAKVLRTNPRAYAALIAAEIQHPGINKVEVAGPGFINLHLEDTFLAQVAREMAESPVLGVVQEGAGKTVVIDFSSPNVAKRMHVGHMRSTHVGHALVNMYRAVGWTAIGDNHIGDWGTPFGKLIVAWRLWRNDAAFATDAIGELERLYVKFNRAADAEVGAISTPLSDAARAETAKLQAGDPENTALWQRFLAVSMAEFEAIYCRMGVTFEAALGESAYKDLTAGALLCMDAAGICAYSEGAAIVRFDQDVLVLQKKDGAVTYGATDVACLLYRVARWNPAKIVYVTDTRQQRHFQQIFDIGQRLGVTADLRHVWFGVLHGMSTRKGNVIRLVDLFDEAVRRARTVVDEKSPGLSDEERAQIAEAVGVGAVRYADLSQNPQTDVTFDWDRMLSFDGNTAPYLLYSHARCCSILARAGETPDLSLLRVEHPIERALVLALVRYPEAVAEALRGSAPNRLADHIYEVATRFNRFHHELHVLNGGERRAARLALVEVTRRVLRHGLETLGLAVLDRM